MKFANITAAAVLAATLPALTLADKCTVKNAKTASTEVTTEFRKFTTAMTSALGEASLKRRALEKRVAAAHEGHDHGDEEEDFYSFECKSDEKCLGLVSPDSPNDPPNTVMCYNEKTSAMHIDKFAMNLKSGDITLPDGTKANVYTNTGPIVTYYKKVEELGYDAAVSGAASATGSAAADGVKASGSVVPASAASTALNGTSSAAPSASTVVEADSAAGKMAVGGWVAAVAVIAMVVV